MTIPRRIFIRNAVALGIGAIIFPPVLMAEKATFEAIKINKTLGFLFADTPIAESNKITLKLPDIAENGKVVPIEVITDLPNVESITILSAVNPIPLVAQFNFKGKVKGRVKTRIKMAGTGNITVVVKADGKLYKTSRQVKVTIGGCGG